MKRRVTIGIERVYDTLNLKLQKPSSASEYETKRNELVAVIRDGLDKALSAKLKLDMLDEVWLDLDGERFISTDTHEKCLKCGKLTAWIKYESGSPGKRVGPMCKPTCLVSEARKLHLAPQTLYLMDQLLKEME